MNRLLRIEGGPDPEHHIDVGHKVKVKNGAVIGQDFSWYRWEDNGDGGAIFTVKGILSDDGKLQLVAYGYGVLSEKGRPYDPHAYGNGAIYVYKKDVVRV